MKSARGRLQYLRELTLHSVSYVTQVCAFYVRKVAQKWQQLVYMDLCINHKLCRLLIDSRVPLVSSQFQ